MSDFKTLNLSTQILSALEKKGYTHPTPIQLQAIPHLLEGKDLLGIAQTGTGKTAAFALPILDNLFKSGKSVQHSNVRTLILTPTRELATQINDNIKLYGEDLNIKSGVIFGGVNMNNQIRAAKNGFDILVATPGRLLDLMNQGVIKFSQLEIFVLDEADRMLDMGFINDVKKIIAKLPKERQTLFFSATMPKDVAVLANSILNNPVRIEVTPESTTVEKIDQRINFVDKANKPLLLKSIIENEGADSLFLVFSKTKHNANRIAEFLENEKIKTAAIHGNKSQGAREKALDGFREGSIKVLVATDIAARGIDIKGITHVINYELPNHPESYVHRIGRTARAGREGIAISFCDNTESSLLKDIEKVIKMKLPVDESHPFHGVKASASAKSALPAKDRPKSGYKTTAKPRSAGARAPSFFEEKKKWHAEREDIRGASKPRFNAEARAPRDNFRTDSKETSAENFGKRPPRPKFSTEGSKPRFGTDSRGADKFSKPRFDSTERSEKPRFNSQESRPSSFSGSSFGDRKPRFENSERGERPARRDFGDKKPFGTERREGNNDRPAFRDSSFKRSDNKFGDRPSKDGDFRSPKPRFGGDDSRSGDKFSRPKFGDDRRSNSYANDDRRSRFTSDTTRDYSKPKRDFGDRKFGDKKPSFGGDRSRSNDRPSFSNSGFDSRKSSSSFGEFSGENRKPRFNSDAKPRSGFGENRGERKSFGGSEGRVGRAFAGGGRSGGKPSGFGGKSGGFGGKKPTRPKN